MITNEDIENIESCLTAKAEDPCEPQRYVDSFYSTLSKMPELKNIIESTNQLEQDLSVLIVIGRMYLDAINEDPDNESLSLPDLIGLQMVRDTVDRYTEVSVS